MLQKQSSLVRSCSGFSLPLYKTLNVTVCGGLVLGWFYSLLLWDNLVQGQVFGKGNAVSCEALSDVLICDLIGIVASIRKYFHHLMVDQQKNAPLSGSLLSYCKKNFLLFQRKWKSIPLPVTVFICYVRGEFDSPDWTRWSIVVSNNLFTHLQCLVRSEAPFLFTLIQKNSHPWMRSSAPVSMTDLPHCPPTAGTDREDQ